MFMKLLQKSFKTGYRLTYNLDQLGIRTDRLSSAAFADLVL